MGQTFAAMTTFDGILTATVDMDEKLVTFELHPDKGGPPVTIAIPMLKFEGILKTYVLTEYHHRNRKG